MTRTLYIATTNAGKLHDFEQVARSGTDCIRLLPLPGLAEIPAPAEDALTFEENAIAKAVAYSWHAPGEIVLADDSGLEVDALDGLPGVRSARYAADAGFTHPLVHKTSSDEANNLLLIEQLRGVPRDLRTARYRCVVAAARDGECVHLAHGTVEGRILEAPCGTGGFGYDPLFFLPQLGGTMAELSLAKKHLVSHRGHALRALLRQICE